MMRVFSVNEYPQRLRMAEAHQDLHFNSANSLLEALRLSNTAMWGQKILCPWVFRGHADSEWELLPRIWRQREIDRLNHKFPSMISVMKSDIQNEGHYDLVSLGYPEHDRLQNVFISNLFERRLVRFFGHLGEEIGLIPYQKWTRKTEVYANLYLDTMMYSYPGEYLDLLSIAQHNGIPTRLIDWSRDPLKALSFSIFSECNSENSSIICLNTNFINNIENISDPHKIYIVESNKTNNQNIMAQNGIFTIIPDSTKFFYENNYFPNLNYYSTYHELKKITFPRSIVEEIRSLLVRERISPAHLMPNLYNCAQTAEALFRMRVQEEHSNTASAT